MNNMTQNIEQTNSVSAHRYFTLIQEIISDLQKFAMDSPNIYSMLKFGSITLNKMDFYSDIDLILIVEESAKKEIKNEILKLYKDNLIETINYENKLIIFIENSIAGFSKPIKIELHIVNSISKVLKYIINSKKQIEEIIDCIIFDKRNQLVNYFNTMNLDDLKKEISLDEDPAYHFNRFIEAFENGSTAMARGDSYTFYFQMSICYHHLINLEYMTLGQTRYLYMPRYFLNKLDESTKEFYRDNPPILNMYKANQLRRLYLNQFKKVLENNELHSKIGFKIKPKINFLENIYQRTFFWNFRDISYINPQYLREKAIFRSSNLSKYSNDYQLQELLTNNNIKSIIDLRRKSEIEFFPYNEELKQIINYYNIPIGEKFTEPEIKLTYTTLEDKNVFYEVLPNYFKKEIKEIMELLSNLEPGIVIHCHAGRDRTGMIIAILLLICDISEELIIEDYMFSGSDTVRSDIELFLRILSDFGGIFSYLHKIGIEDPIIEKIRNKMMF